MFANEFFQEVGQCCGSECSNVVVNVDGIEITHIKYHGETIENLETLLLLKDIYSPNVYMYARLRTMGPSYKEIEILDSNARELGDLRIEGVELIGTKMVIYARIVGSD